MMVPWVQLLLIWFGAAVMMMAFWLIQRRTGDAGIVDVGWSFGLGLSALFLAATSGGDPERRLVLAVCAGFWAFRLAGYLLVNRILSGPEDGRYQELRAKWGNRAQVNLLIFFQFQAFLVPLFSLPFLVVAWNAAAAWSWTDWTAIAIWLIAVAGEAIADRQLARFRARPESRGRTCREGLWRYSRHPNYFFEWLHWWAWVLLAAGHPWWWIALAGPALMLLFLFKITGIPATEERALRTRGDDYRRYQATTSAFIPWFPKEEPR